MKSRDTDSGNNAIYSKPPTKRMIAKLRECLEKNDRNEKFPCRPEEMKSSLAGLYKRGLIETRMETIDGKKLLCVYVSDTGKSFLKSLDESAA